MVVRSIIHTTDRHICYGFKAMIHQYSMQINIKLHINIITECLFLIIISYNTLGRADTLLYRANARYSICLLGLVCYRTDGVQK